MIRLIDSGTYVRFLSSNQAQKKQVSINGKGIQYGYYESSALLGVISIADTKNTRRVKGFLINERQQGKEIGKSLLDHVLIDDKDMTTFATAYMLPLFKRCGFKSVKKNDNDVTFMKRAAKKNKKFEVTDKEIEHIRIQLAELAEQILSLERDKRRSTVEYVCNKLKELIR
jgi:hypothetical protein